MNPMQWLAVEVANKFGNDKLELPDRVQWVKDNYNQLESLASMADKPAQYSKAVRALYDAKAGKEIFQPVGLDASASGIQIMSAMMRCIKGCENTNLTNGPIKDTYTVATDIYNTIRGSKEVFDRKVIKDVTMTHFYGSINNPKEVFNTEETLGCFYETMNTLAPRANALRDILINAWNPKALVHTWTMPDGYTAYIPVMNRQEFTIEEPAYGIKVGMISYVNEPVERDVSLAANVIHSFDAYVLRSMSRRLNYNKQKILKAKEILENAYLTIKLGKYEIPYIKPRYVRLLKIYRNTQMADVRICNYLTKDIALNMSESHIKALLEVIERMLKHPPFDLITNHDYFACLPSNCNRMAEEYREILAELSDSNSLKDVLAQLGVPNVVPRSPRIGHIIRNSVNALT